jgi:ubiquinone biosynthesis protein COQ9
VTEGKNEGGKPMDVGAKVKELTWRRLMANDTIIHRWQEVCLHSAQCRYYCY